MMSRTVICGLLVLSLAINAPADEKKKKKGAADRAPMPTQRFLVGMELTAEQKEKVKSLNAKLAGTAKELAAKRQAILTDDQRKAENDARKAAQADGKNPAETRKATQDALKLTAEQQEKMKALQQSQREFNAQAIAGLKEILTPEQQAKLPSQAGGKKGNADAPKGKKKKTE